MADKDDDEPLSHPHHPKVLAVIRAVLLENRWPAHDLDEGIGLVEEAALLAKNPPTTVGGWKALCRKIAHDKAVDRIRSNVRDGKASERPTARADEHVAPTRGDHPMDDAIDRRRALEEMAAALPPEDVPVFERLALGAKPAEIARELKKPKRTVTRQVENMRERFTAQFGTAKKAGTAGVVALLLLGGALLIFRKQLWPNEEAHNQPPAPVPSLVPSAPPSAEPEVPVNTDKQKAEALRQDAFVQLKAKEWRACLHDIVEANGLDPATATPLDFEQGREAPPVRLSLDAGRPSTEADALEFDRKVTAVCVKGFATSYDSKGPGAPPKH